jgi:hypothetical protein
MMHTLGATTPSPYRWLRIVMRLDAYRLQARSRITDVAQRTETTRLVTGHSPVRRGAIGHTNEARAEPTSDGERLAEVGTRERGRRW